MNIILEEIRLSDDLEPGLRELLEHGLKNLHHELEAPAAAFPFIGPKEIFGFCTEMTWVSLWKNALERHYREQMHTLQEITVYNTVDGKQKHLGRRDLMVRINGSPSLDLLFEAKMGEWKGHAPGLNKRLEKKYTEIYRQARRYVACLKDYSPMTIAICFDWFRTEKAIAAARKIRKEGIPAMPGQFDALYSSGMFGVWVHGAASKIVSQPSRSSQ